MKYVFITAVVAGLAVAAVIAGSATWFAAVAGIAGALIVGRNARLTTSVQLLFVGALCGGLGFEIVRSIASALQGSGAEGGNYREAMIVALGSVIVVLGAMIVEYLLHKLLSRSA